MNKINRFVILNDFVTIFITFLTLSFSEINLDKNSEKQHLSKEKAFLEAQLNCIDFTD